MSKIDLSKAKIGDMFQTRNGKIVEYIGVCANKTNDLYALKDEKGFIYYFNEDGSYMTIAEHELDLIEQVFVFNAPLDELIEEETKQIKENDDAIAEEKELQRREEVLKYADMLFFNQKDTRIALFGYDVAIVTAESIVKSRDKYLKDGKLC